MFSKFRKKTKNKNFIEDVFDMAEVHTGPRKSKDITDKELQKTLTRIEVDVKSEKEDVKITNFEQMEEYSPIMAHFVKNQILKELAQKVMDLEIEENNQIRFFDKNRSTIKYINLKPMSVISDNISIMDQNGDILDVNFSEQAYCQIPVELEQNGKSYLVQTDIYTGVLKCIS